MEIVITVKSAFRKSMSVNIAKRESASHASKQSTIKDSAKFSFEPKFKFFQTNKLENYNFF